MTKFLFSAFLIMVSVGQIFTQKNQDNKAGQLDITGGNFIVHAQKNDDWIEAQVRLFQAGTKNEIITAKTHAGEMHKPTALNVDPGIYDIEAALGEDKSRQTIKYYNVEISQSVKDTFFDFTVGNMEITATNNGDLTNAMVNIRRHGTSASVSGGGVGTSKDSNPMITELYRGFYDVHITANGLNGPESTAVHENIYVNGEKDVKIHHKFSSGILEVRSSKNTNHEGAVVSVKSANTGVLVAGGRIYDNPASDPISFALTPGDYQVIIKSLKSGNSKALDVTVKKKKTIKKVVSFD